MRMSTRLAITAILPLTFVAISAPAQASSPSAGIPAAKTKLITAKQVATHDSAANCWIIFKRGVYNVSRLASQSGSTGDAFSALCGTDSTRAVKSQFPSTADTMFKPFKVGVLKGKPLPTSAPTSKPAGGISRADVGMHGGAYDCWIIFGTNVYNITPLLDKDYNAGVAANQTCGGDGTAAFTGLYGAGAVDALAPYKVGALAS